MVLCTLPDSCEKPARERLEKNNINYIIRPIGNNRFNIFFGERFCLEVVERFGNKPLNQLTPEEDFILGAMLGYSVCEQCKRYCKRVQPKN